ncbi:T9SS type A sorting domain-containing protein [Flammeovirga pectinis]|uniref:T9SS type A sorting domain-containing protein n=1 Tax=Flammeovirga pectinis TaxID=2494373 RepID=A0A3Q9FP97_9BACT|nr:T9SS type A sorting domain-containing protein [Flammeovirga pectinis]AZQ61682.1 T9SS type A sorting domain-containing protein [Flammeovirga pectinis]
MAKRLYQITALFYAFVFLLIQNSNAQTATETHSFISPNSTLNFGEKIKATSDDSYFATYMDNEVNIFQFSGNALSHEISIQPEDTYMQRDIEVDGTRYTFYLLPTLGYITNDNNDSMGTVSFLSSSDENHEIWITQKDDKILYYIEVEEQELGSYKSTSKQVVEFSNKIDFGVLFNGSRFEEYPTITVETPIEDPNKLFGNDIVFYSDYQIFISDPQYNGYQGRILMYQIESGIWTKKSEKNIDYNFTTFFSEFGRNLSLTGDSFSRNVLISQSKDQLYIIKTPTSTPNIFNESDSYLLNSIEQYPNTEIIKDHFSTFVITEDSPETQNLYLTMLNNSDYIYFKTLVNITPFNSIHDVVNIPNTDNIIITGERSGNEVIELYTPSTDFSNYTLSVSKNLNPTSVSSHLKLFQYNNKIGLLSRQSNKVFIYNNTDLSVDGSISFSSVDDWNTFGESIYPISNNFVIGDIGVELTINQVPYTTVQDGQWHDSDTWSNGIIPNYQDDNSLVNIKHNVSLSQHESPRELIVEGSGSLTLIEHESGEGSGYIEPDIFTNNGLIKINENTGFKIREAGLNNGIIETYSLIELKGDFINNNGISLYNGNSILIQGDYTNNGTISYHEDNDNTSGYIIQTNGKNISVAINSSIPNFLTIEEGDATSIVTFSGNLSINGSFNINTNLVDFSSLTLTMGMDIDDSNVPNIFLDHDVSIYRLKLESDLLIDGFGNGILSITDNLNLLHDITLEGVDIIVTYKSSGDIITGDGYINTKAGYYNALLYDLSSNPTPPFTLKAPLQSQIDYGEGGGPEEFQDASSEITVTSIDYNSGTNLFVIFPVINSADVDETKTINTKKYGVIPGKSWEIEGVGINSFAFNLNGKVNSTAPFTSEASDLVAYSYSESRDPSDVVTPVTGGFPDVNFSDINGDNLYSVEVLTTSLQKSYETAKDGLWSDTNTWSNGIIPPSDINSIAIINHSVTLDYTETIGTIEIANNKTLNVDGSGVELTVNSITNNGILNIINDAKLIINNEFNNSLRTQLDQNSVLELNCDFNNQSLINFDGNSSLYIDGEINNGSGSYNFNSENTNVVLNPSKDISIDIESYIPNLTINGSNKITFNNQLNVKSDLTINNNNLDFTTTSVELGFGGGNPINIAINTDLHTTFKDLTISSYALVGSEWNSHHFTILENFTLYDTLAFNEDECIIRLGDEITGEGGQLIDRGGYLKGDEIDLGFYIDPSKTNNLSIPIVQSRRNHAGDFYLVPTNIDIDLSNISKTVGYDNAPLIKVFPYKSDFYEFTYNESKYYSFPETQWVVQTEGLSSFTNSVSTNLSRINAFPHDSNLKFAINNITEYYNNEQEAPLIGEFFNIYENTVYSDSVLTSTSTVVLNTIENNSFFLIHPITNSLREISSINDGDWYNNATWENGAIPQTESDSVIIKHNVSYTHYVEFPDSIKVRGLNIESGALSVNGDGYNAKFKIANGLTVKEDAVFNLSDTELIALGNIAIDGTIVEGSVSELPSLLKFYGNEISGTGTISINRFEILSTDIETTSGSWVNRSIYPLIQIDGSGGYIDAEGSMITTFYQPIEFNDNTSIFKSMEYVVLEGDTEVNQTFTINTIDSESNSHDYNFKSLTINNVNTVNVNSNTVIREQLILNTIENVNIAGVTSLTIKGINEDDDPLIEISPLSITNVQNIMGDNITQSILDVTHTADQNKPYAINTNVQYLNVSGDSLFVVGEDDNYTNNQNIRFLASTPYYYEGEIIVSTLEDSVRLPVDYIGGTLHEDESYALIQTDDVGNNIQAISTFRTYQDYSSSDSVIIALSDLISIDRTIEQSINIQLAVVHVPTAVNSDIIGYENITITPYNTVHSTDLSSIVDFVTSFEFKNSTIEDELGWTSEDLENWNGNFSSLSNSENHFTINEFGYIKSINFENTNLNGWDLSTLSLYSEFPGDDSKGEFPPEETEGEFEIPIFENEGENLIFPLTYLSDIFVNGNFLDFNDFGDYDYESYTITYDTPANPQDIFNISSYVAGNSYSIDLLSEGIQHYGQTDYTWYKEVDGVKVDLENHTSIQPFSLYDDSGKYIVELINSDNPYLPDFTLEIEFNISMQLGVQDKDLVASILSSLEIETTEDDFRDWAPEIFTIDNEGYVTSIDISGRDLTTLPSNINNFINLETLNISNNHLYFDQILAVTYSELSQFNYLDQSYNVIQNSDNVEHGSINFTFDGQIENDESLTYQWVRQSNSDVVSNTSSFAINPMTINDADTYILSVQHDNVSGLAIQIHQYDINHVLGNADKDELKTLLTEIGVDTESTDDMRLWGEDENIVIIDSTGYVTSIDISGRELTTLPSNINNFINLETLNISNNHLYFDQILAVTYSGLSQFNYLNQSYNVIQNSNNVEHGSINFTFDGTIENDESLTYQWVRQSNSDVVSNTSSFAINPMTINDADTYILSVQHDNVSGLAIQIHQYDINHVLGNADKDELKTLLTEIGVDTESTDDMRLWGEDENIVIIDSTGYVTSIDISGRDLTNLPSNINNFINLETLNISNNHLYFDQILAVTYSELSQFNYLNQSYNVIQNSNNVEHGSIDFTFDGTIENDESLIYQWVRQSNSDVVSNTSSFAINPMTINDADTYILSVQHDNVSGLAIQIHQYDINHVLGNADKDELKTLLTEIGVDTESTDDMRLWGEDENIVIIDSTGYVTSIDISGRDLTNLPSNINNFINLETLNISNNHLYFDQILTVTYSELSQFNYLNQSYNVIQNSNNVEHGSIDFTFDGTIENDESLIYQWVKQSNSEVVSNTSSFAINPMTINDADTYILSVQHDNVSGLAIQIHQYDVNHVLGNADKDELKTLLTEIGVDTESTDDMRLWDEDENIVIIDSTGYVTSIDISGRDLTNLPSNINNFINLETLNISNNHLYFDQILAVTYSGLNQFNYLDQSYNVIQNSNDVEHGSIDFTFDGQIENDESLTYQWIRQSNSDVVSNTSSFAINPMTINDADTYILSVQHDNVSGLAIQIHQYDINHVLGNADKDELKTLLTEIGVDTESTDDMRLWDEDENIVIIDSTGYVTSIDISGRDLTNLPSNINNFINLDVLDISNNKLFFDDIEPYLDYNISYEEQTYNFISLYDTISYGNSYSYQGQLEGFESLEYNWYNTENIQIGNNSLYNINFATGDSTGIIRLIVSSSEVDNLDIKIAELNLTYTLGNEDSLLVKQLLDEIGYTNYSNQDEFRTWLGERTEIDNYGRLITIDLSAFDIDGNDNLLTSLPSQLLSFNYLTSIKLENNLLFFDDLDGVKNLSEIITYNPQNYNKVEETYNIVQYDNFDNNYSIEGYEGDLVYQWYFNGEIVANANTPQLNVVDFNISKEGAYSLKVSHPSLWEGLSIETSTINLVYQSLISEEDSAALFELYTYLNVDFDPSERIVLWPRMEFDDNGKIVGLNLHELETNGELPDLIGRFTDLKSLKLYNSGITTLSDSLWTLTGIEYLDLSNNNINDNNISGIQDFTNLTTLWLSNNNLTLMPNLTGNSKLQNLIIDDNSIISISEELSGLTSLTNFSIAGNGITTITMDFSDLINLKKLNFSRNELSVWDNMLPSGLEELILYSNLLTSLSNIPSTIEVNVADNYLFFDDFDGFNDQNLAYSPQNYIIYYESIAMISGGDYTFNLPISLDGLTYTWYKDGVIQPSLGSKTLVFENMSNNDVGVYSCFITHTYWSNLSIKVAEIGIGIDCGDDLDVALQANTTTIFCFGEEIEAQLQANSTASNLTFSWYKNDELLPLLTSSAITIHEQGTYSVKIRNLNGCIAFSDSIIVAQSNQLLTPQIVVNQDSLFVENPGSSYNYFWYLDGELIDQSGTEISANAPGDYMVEVINNSGCTMYSEEYTIQSDVINSVDDLASQITISIFPQPATDVLNISTSIGKVNTIRIFDQSGKLFPVSFNTSGKNTTVNVNGIQSGLYVLEVNTTSTTYHEKILIN